MLKGNMCFVRDSALVYLWNTEVVSDPCGMKFKSGRLFLTWLAPK